jgi:hypothetical protein
MCDLTFEQYCIEVINIPYYNFLCGEEYEFLYDQFEKYCKEYNHSLMI